MKRNRTALIGLGDAGSARIEALASGVRRQAGITARRPIFEDAA